MSKQATTYSNFQDPVGLALRMLRRGSYESLWPLLQSACGVFSPLLDKKAASWEQEFEDVDHWLPQILIVGLPRSGTTLVSQVLARNLQVSYFPNVSALFPSAPIWATKKFVKNFARPPESEKSFYGSTSGLRGVSDGFHIWNRWLGENRYCIDRTPSDQEAIGLQDFFGRWNAAFQLPLLNKNNRNVDGLVMLASLLPNAFFVVVRRDPLMTVQSLLQAREFIQGAASHGWGLYSDRFREISDPIESTCQQVTYGQNRLAQQLTAFTKIGLLSQATEIFVRRRRSLLRRA